MQKKFAWLAVSVLMFGVLVAVAPNANAAVTLFCNSATVFNNADYRHAYPDWTPNYHVRYIKPDFNGEVYFAVGLHADKVGPAAHNLDSYIANNNKNCSIDWVQEFSCPIDEPDGTQFQCVYTNPIPDPAGGIVNFAKTTNGDGGGTTIGQQYQRLNPATGAVYSEIPVYELPTGNRFGAQNSPVAPTDGDSFILNGIVYTITTAGIGCCANGLGGGDTTIRVFDDEGVSWTVSYPAAGQRPVSVTAQSGVATPYAFFSGGNTVSASALSTQYIRLNLVDHTFSGAITGATNFGQVFSVAPPRQGYGAESGEVFVIHSGGAGTAVIVEKINIAAWTTTSETTLAGTFGAINDWDIDGSNNFLLCGQNGAGTALTLYKGDLAAATITEIYSEATPPGWTGFRGASCKFDYNGGFNVMAQGGCTGPGAVGASNCMIHKRFLNNDVFTNPTYPKTIDTTIYAGLGGTTGTLTGTNNPIGAAVDYFADSWGIDFAAAGALFSITILGFLAIRMKGFHTIIIAVVMFLGIEFCIRLGLLEDWLRFVVIFIIIAVAAHQLFERRAQAEDGDSD